MALCYSVVCILSLGLIISEFVAAVPRGLQEALATNGRPGNPGFKVRITHSALNYVESLAIKAMTDQFPHVRINDVSAKIKDGDVHMNNIRITNYKPPETHGVTLEPPDTIRWTTSNSDLSLHGDFHGRQQVLLSKVPLVGDFDAVASSMDFSLSFSVYKSDDGGILVKSRQCQVNIKHLTANVHIRLTSVGAAVAAVFKNSIVNQLKSLLVNELCQDTRRFIDEELNKQLATAPKKIPLNQTSYEMRNAQQDPKESDSSTENEGDKNKPASKNGANQQKKSSNDIRKLTNALSKHLVLDYSNTKDPLVTDNYIETCNRGEISYEGQGGTPFYPTGLQEPTPVPTSRMIYITASDYMLNSLLWHAYKHGLLTMHADGRKYPQYKSMLRTSCDDDVFAVCIGNVVPEVGKSFPNSNAEIIFQAIKAPAVFFQKDGHVKLVAPSYVTAYARQGNDLKEMMTADLYVEEQLRVWIENQLLKSNGTITKFNMTLRNNNLQHFDQRKLNDLSDMVKAMIQEQTNNDLMQGLPLPSIEGATLVNPHLRIFERTVRIETDAIIDESVLSKLARRALRDGNSKLTLDSSGEDDHDQQHSK